MALTHWTTSNGIKYKITDMTVSHIQNCIKHLEERISMFGPAGGRWEILGVREGLVSNIEDFKKELKRRDLNIKWL